MPWSCICLYLLVALGAPDALMAQGGFTVVALAAAAMIAAAVDGRWPLARVVGARPVGGLGRVSYGVYLWHYPAFALVRVHGPHDVAARFALGLGLTALATAASWRFVERPAALAFKLRSEQKRGASRQGSGHLPFGGDIAQTEGYTTETTASPAVVCPQGAQAPRGGLVPLAQDPLAARHQPPHDPW